MLPSPATLGHSLLVLGIVVSSCEPPKRARNAVLYYLHAAQISRDTTRPLVAYLGADGTPRDLMFDAIIIDDRGIEKGTDYVPDAVAVGKFEEALFDDGQLRTLADVVSVLRAELGNDTHRLRVYLAAPFSPDT